MQKHQRFSSRWKKSWWQKLDYERFQTSNLHHFYHMPSIKEIPTGWKLYVCCPWSARMETRRVQSELPNVQAYGEQKVFNGRNFVSFSAGGEWRSTCKRRHLKHPDSSNQSHYWGDGLSFSHSLTLLAQIPQLGGKIIELLRNNIPSANPAIPLASVLGLIGFTSEKVLWNQTVVIPVGGDGNNFYFVKSNKNARSRFRST